MPNLEQLLLTAIFQIQKCESHTDEERHNLLQAQDILYALRGYLTEEGTAIVQDELLRKCGFKL